MASGGFSMLNPLEARAAQRSMHLSMLSVALSACALIVSMSEGATGWRSHGNAPLNALTRESPLKAFPSNHVTLSGLHIEAGQIASAAVGPAELADGAVTAAKLADGAVTARSLESDAIHRIANVASGSQHVVGEVDESANIMRGDRFTAERTAIGEYIVHFREPFASPPVVLAVAQSYGVCYVPAQAVEVASVRIKCMSDLLGSAPHAVSTRFSFYAAYVAATVPLEPIPTMPMQQMTDALSLVNDILLVHRRAAL
jgi:hypothetical protein